MQSLPLNFWLENAHFIIYALAALGLFAAGWLNFDSYRQKPDKKILFRALGFFILALWALAISTGYDMVWLAYAMFFAELIGIGLVAVGFYMEPIPRRPGQSEPGSRKNSVKRPVSLAVLPLSPLKLTIFNLPIIGWLLVLIRVWKFATVGLLKDFLGLRTAILFFFLSRVVSLAEFFSGSDNPWVFNLTKEFSYLWMLENLFVLIAAIVLVRWVFFYIHFRPAPQMYITFVTVSFIVFIISTVAFTGSLFNLSQNDSIISLKRSAAVFEFTLKELKNQTNLAAYSLSQRDEVIAGASNNNVEEAKEGLGDPVKDLNVGGAAITNRAGEVLAVVGSYINVGESLVNDPAVFRSLEGEATQSFITEQLLDADEIVVRAAFPIVVDAKVQGSVVVDYPIDQAFVDNVREVTNLDVSINTGIVHAATTFLDKNNRRITGTLITNQEVIELTEDRKEIWAWSGSERLVDQPYLTAYRSLANADNINIGSVLVGQSKYDIIGQIDYSIRLTFSVAIILILVSLFPLYFISRKISKSIKA